MYLKIQKDAIFIADAHYNNKNQELKNVLLQIKELEIKTSQLFLMGDIFDFLTYETKYFININQDIITLINEISKTIEVIYLEGNHDFNLQKIFPLIKVYKREQQPLLATYNNNSVSLSHGDILLGDLFYDIFCNIIRNKYFLRFLNFIDFNCFISKSIDKKLSSKMICSTISNFYDIIEKKIKNYNTDIVIEGHYHQNKVFMYGKTKYINLPSLACTKEYFCANEILSNSK